jgi:hypothetical protein
MSRGGSSNGSHHDYATKDARGRGIIVSTM